jgi:hypothetical protein
VQITWMPPFDGSHQITGYLIKIRTSDGVTFIEDATNCNGLETAIISALSCTEPISALIVAPYSLPWGSHVFTQVYAINQVGMSPASSEGNGAKIITNPDSPVNLANDPDNTTGTQIRFSWEEGAANGGSDVIDY